MWLAQTHLKLEQLRSDNGDDDDDDDGGGWGGGGVRQRCSHRQLLVYTCTNHMKKVIPGSLHCSLLPVMPAQCSIPGKTYY